MGHAVNISKERQKSNGGVSSSPLLSAIASREHWISVISGASEALSCFLEGCADDRLALKPYQHNPSTLFCRGGSVRATVDTAEANVCAKCEQIWGVDEDSGRPKDSGRPQWSDRIPSAKRRDLPESSLIIQFGSSLREIYDTWGGSRKKP